MLLNNRELALLEAHERPHTLYARALFSQCPLEFKVALWLGWSTAVGKAWRDFYWLTPIICFAENEL